MNFGVALSLATAFLVATIIIFATKAFFPYHRTVALSVYAVGWIPFIYAIMLQKKYIQQHQDMVISFFQAFWLHIVFGFVMLLVLYVFVVLFPVEKSPFLGLDDKTIKERLDEDSSVIVYVQGELERNLQKMHDSNMWNINLANISNEQKSELEEIWLSYIEGLLTLDVLKERYKTFYQLNTITQTDLHRQAFENGYAALISQHYYALRFVENVKDPNLSSFFNQSFPEYGVEKGTLDLMRGQLTNPDELLRLSTGRAYFNIIGDQSSELYSSIVSHLGTIRESLNTYSRMVAVKPLHALERNSFRIWFPIQKQSAIKISYVRASTRDYHISPEKILEYKDKLLPGDIFLERREWHATNVGIPGFWTHNALYIGTLEDLNSYFKDIPQLNGMSFEEYLEANQPNILRQITLNDEDGYPFSVIESKRPGVILTSLEYTGNADSFAALRVKDLTMEERFKIVMQGLAYLGKPYDFDFNFVTDDALVCSELVYKAYADIAKLSVDLQNFNGRLILSPNQFAEKFAEELNNDHAQLELVFFLDGNEKEGTVAEEGEDVFATTWQRPKWHVAKDFLNFQ